jgi:hypothetical protein
MDYIEKDKKQHQDKDGNGFWNLSILSVTKVLLELPIQNTRVLDTTFSLSGRMGRSRLNLSISLARMTQWLALSMLASTDYLRKKDGNDSRELRNVKRRCFVWSTSLVSKRLAMHQGTSSAISQLRWGNAIWPKEW